MQLRDYQRQMIGLSLESIELQKSTVLCSPTGTGKSVVIGELTNILVNLGYKVLIVTPSILLVNNLERYLSNLGCKVVKGNRPFIGGNVLVGVFLSVSTRLEKISRWLNGKQLVTIHDEVHHSASVNWDKIFSLPCRCHIGLSATPLRLDGKPLVHFERCFQVADVGWFIENKYLAPVEEYGIPAPNVEDTIHKLDAQFMRFSKEHPKYLENWQKHGFRADGSVRPTLVYACSVEHCEQICATYNKVYPGKFKVVSSKDSKGYIRDTLAELKDGKLWGVMNVQLLTEGVDLPLVEVVQICRATESISLFRQIVGRALRPAGEKVATVLDHAGNLERLGGIMTPINWAELFNKEKAESVKKAKSVCPACEIGVVVDGICNYCFNVIVKSTRKPPKLTDTLLVRFEETIATRIVNLRHTQKRYDRREAALRAMIHPKMSEADFWLIVHEIGQWGMSSKKLAALKALYQPEPSEASEAELHNSR